MSLTFWILLIIVLVMTAGFIGFIVWYTKRTPVNLRGYYVIPLGGFMIATYIVLLILLGLAIEGVI